MVSEVGAWMERVDRPEVLLEVLLERDCGCGLDGEG